jgi:hypothetical protein
MKNHATATIFLAFLLFASSCGDDECGGEIQLSQAMCSFPLDLTLNGISQTGGPLDIRVKNLPPEYQDEIASTCHCETVDGKWTCSGQRFCYVGKTSATSLTVAMSHPRVSDPERPMPRIQITWNGETRGGPIAGKIVEGPGDVCVDGEWANTCESEVATVDFAQLDEVPAP